MSLPVCCFRFSISSHKPLNLSGNVVITFNWIRPVVEPVVGRQTSNLYGCLWWPSFPSPTLQGGDWEHCSLSLLAPSETNKTIKTFLCSFKLINLTSQMHWSPWLEKVQFWILGFCWPSTLTINIRFLAFQIHDKLTQNRKFRISWYERMLVRRNC